MAFPKKILGLFPVGWKDRGYVGYQYVNGGVGHYTGCNLCKTIARIGIEKNERFLFCKKCLIKLKQ